MLNYRTASVRKLVLNLIFSPHLVKSNDNWKLPTVRTLAHTNRQHVAFSLLDTVREKERELIAALQSQHAVSNCLFNGHPHSRCSTSSGHSSPTHQLIDTNNNPTTTTTPSCSSAMFYPPSAVTPPPLQNAASSLDPNAQDFCLTAHSTGNN
jgi:hypothetical protein